MTLSFKCAAEGRGLLFHVLLEAALFPFQGCFKSDVTAVLALRLRLGFDERVALGTGVNDPLTDENERDNREGRNGEAAPAEGSGQIVVDYAVEDD
ncbi:hypothetical protein CQR58_009860 [Streptomyces acidiscabies]|uniref:hypothetical protein n=1 Tax=Streptomyces acidiscabies TaxID=42234 RepID=UPI0013C48F28|nr:hypothetical protein [Streptomyces acidiscabies]